MRPWHELDLRLEVSASDCERPSITGVNDANGTRLASAVTGRS
jgi:hypothetical protein